jgi:hypothetical protein
VERADVRPEDSHRLLPGPDDLLAITEGRLQGEPIAGSRQNLHDGRRRLGAEERHPTRRLVHQYHPDYPAGRPPRRQDRLVPLDRRLAVQGEQAGGPPATLSSPLGQVDAVLALDPRPAAPPGRTRLGHSPQGHLLAEPTDDRHPHPDRRLEEGGLGLGPVGDHPQRLAEQPLPDLGPSQQLDGQR